MKGNTDNALIDAKLFEPSSDMSSQRERIARVHHSAFYDGWIRLRKNKAAVGSFAVLIILSLLAVFAPVFSPFTYYDTDYTAKFMLPGGDHIFGTDLFGRDLWARIWHGTRMSLLIGLSAAFINLFIGVTYGSVSAIAGGNVDNLMQRIIELLVGIPSLIILILMMVVLPPGVWTIIIALSVTGWVNMARLVRAEILRLKMQEFVLAARLLGTPPSKIIIRHLVPNTVSVIVIQTMFSIPAAIFSEAFLSFIGLGIAEPKASLGVLINTGYGSLRTSPHMLIFPSIVIVLIMMCFCILGDGLRDAFDPRMRQ
ncbi:MAG: ABC transporter permease [Treponema sp.]|jgi:oligopeptide transport system permease protein|nr:ABC transporter permease [Treponema sp.]